MKSSLAHSGVLGTQSLARDSDSRLATTKASSQPELPKLRNAKMRHKKPAAAFPLTLHTLNVLLLLILLSGTICQPGLRGAEAFVLWRAYQGPDSRLANSATAPTPNPPKLTKSHSIVERQIVPAPDAGSKFPLPSIPKPKYNYVKALHMSLLYFWVQRSGRMPYERLAWRSHSCADCKGPSGEDLSGGWYEAANTMKFGQAFHHTHLVLAWTAYAYRDQLGRIGELDELRSWVKQGADYTFNAHSRADRLVGMFNIADRVDFDYEGPPEEWASLMKFSRANGSFAAYVDRVHRGSEIVGDAAAAMAASYLVFRDSEPAYAGKCLNASKSLYALASDYQGSFIYGGWAAKNPSMASHLVSYRSSGVYQDEIAVAASFLYLATNETKYLNAAKGMFGWALNKMSYKLPVYFSWDDKLPGVAFLLSMVDGKPGNTYDKLLRQGFAFWLKDCQGKKCGPGEAPRTKACKCVYYTPKGLAVGDAWGSLASVTNIGFVMLQHAHWLRSFNATDSYAAKLIDWVISQVNYILGDNNGFSFMAGFGTKFPRFSYHISSYNSLIDFPMRGKPMNLVAYDFEMQGTSRVFKTQNRFIPYGAIQGGPCYNNDTIVDNHRDYVFTESAQDYAAAFLGAAAGLIDVYKLNEKGTDCGLDLGWSHRNANRAKRYPKYKANDAYHTCFGKSKDEIARLMAE